MLCPSPPSRTDVLQTPSQQHTHVWVAAFCAELVTHSDCVVSPLNAFACRVARLSLFWTYLPRATNTTNGTSTHSRQWQTNNAKNHTPAQGQHTRTHTRTLGTNTRRTNKTASKTVQRQISLTFSFLRTFLSMQLAAHTCARGATNATAGVLTQRPRS